MVMLAPEKTKVQVADSNLLQIIREGNLEAIRLFFGEAPSSEMVNACEPICGTVFNYAICYGTMEIVQFLSLAAQLNGFGKDDYTPLDYALAQDYLGIFYFLCSIGAHQVNHPIIVEKNRFRNFTS